ncbi:MAG: hypothetical protein JG776_349 [Caloramator sp.]|uniref:hypothetical protein n=1 Tax=Caloramator sp. TaxID=1871330 RepID=UPI001DCCB632|nr:hypothetical protein [Caloramator sp.]MBZ4662667.1 hypothetical protein [Caloramator sp.]
MIFTPIFINFLITEVIYFAFDANKLIKQSIILNYYIMLLIICIIFFLQSLVLGIITSNSLFHIASGLLINFIPFILISVLNLFLNVAFYGLYLEDSLTLLVSNKSFIAYLFPLLSWLNSEIVFSKVGFVGYIYLLLTILIYFLLSYILFTKRKNEKATNLVVFDSIAEALKYFNTTLLMFGVSSLATMIAKGDIFTVFISGLIGAFVGYYFSEALIKRNLKVYRNLKGYLIVVSIWSIFLLISQTEMIFRHSPPKLDDIESVCISNNKKIIYDMEYGSKAPRFHIKNKETIKKVLSLQQHITSLKRDYSRLNSVYIVYRLKNGREIKRLYEGSFDSKYNEYMQLISLDEGYKKINYDIFNIDYKDFNKVMIFMKNKNEVEINDREKIEFVVNNIRRDILNNSYQYKDDVIFDGVDKSKGSIEIYYGYDGQQYKYTAFIIDTNNKWIDELIK